MKRIPSLDGLRAFAITLVLIDHLSTTQGFPFTPPSAGEYGRLGVRVFFVISGYLITTLLLKEHAKTGTISLKDFYVRRAYRIFPAMYAFIAISALSACFVIHIKDLLAASFYVANYIHPVPVFEHLWSLAIEEQFYLLWPVLLLCFFSRRVGILIAGLIIAPVFRGAIGVAGFEQARVWFPAVQDALAIGCLMAVLGDRLNGLRRWVDKLILPIALLTFLAPAFSYPHGVQPVVILSLLNVGIALCVDHVIRHPYWILNNAPVEWVGRLSYSLYLWQQAFLEVQIRNGWWTHFPVNLCLALIAACASHYLVELPLLRLRERRRARRSGMSSVSTGTAAESSPVS